MRKCQFVAEKNVKKKKTEKDEKKIENNFLCLRNFFFFTNFSFYKLIMICIN